MSRTYLSEFVRSRVLEKLIIHFCNHTEPVHYRQLVRLIGEDVAATHHQLRKLVRVGLVTQTRVNTRVVCQTNQSFELIEELRALSGQLKKPGM